MGAVRRGEVWVSEKGVGVPYGAECRKVEWYAVPQSYVYEVRYQVRYRVWAQGGRRGRVPWLGRLINLIPLLPVKLADATQAGFQRLNEYLPSPGRTAPVEFPGSLDSLDCLCMDDGCSLDRSSKFACE